MNKLTKIRYLLFVSTAGLLTACGSGSCISPNITLGSILLSPDSSTIYYGNSESITLSLNNSLGVNNLIVNLSDNKENIISISPKTCTLSTTNPTCTISVLGNNTGDAIITAHADGYNNTIAAIKVGYTPTAYLSDYDDGLLLYNINADGSLIYRESAPIPTGISAKNWFPFGNVTTNGHFVYLADNSNGAVWIYSMSSNGSLSYLESAPTPNGSNSWSPYSIVFNESNVYIGDWGSGGHIWKYSVNITSGRLTYINEQPYTTIVTGLNPFNLAINGSYLYVSASNYNSSGAVLKYQIDSNAELNYIESVTIPSNLTGWSPEAVAFNGNYAYIASFNDFSNNSDISNLYGGSIWKYAISNNGSLINPESEPMHNGITRWTPDSLAIYKGNLYMGDDKMDSFDIINNYGNANIFSINPVTGNINFFAPIPYPTGYTYMDTYGIAFN